MKNQHEHIKGYRDLSQGEIDLINEIKSAGVMLQMIVDKVQKHVEDQFEQADSENSEIEVERIRVADPYEWLIAAKADLQTGLMKLTRSVAQPTTF